MYMRKNQTLIKAGLRAGLGLLFGVGSWLLSCWGHAHPDWVEQWYSRGLFQVIRQMGDGSVGRLPVPAFYLFWLFVLLFWVWQIRTRPTLLGWPQRVGFWGLKITGFSGVILGLFFWLWGFNYGRTPLAQQLSLRPVPLDTAALWDELCIETAALTVLRTQLAGTDTTALNDERLWPHRAEDTVRAAVKTWLAARGFPVSGRVRGRALRPSGMLLAFSTAGIYWPFAGEGNVDWGLHPLQKLPVMAHEMGHAYGFGDEGVCNFIAYAAGYRHPNAYIAYTSRLSYWRTVAVSCLQQDPERYARTVRSQLPAGLRQDVRAIEARMNEYRELFPRWRNQVYDAYLKSQGIPTGMLNYSEVIMLVRAMRNLGD
jgi:Protein of unknown function (DUF3810)